MCDISQGFCFYTLFFFAQCKEDYHELEEVLSVSVSVSVSVFVCAYSAYCNLLLSLFSFLIFYTLFMISREGVEQRKGGKVFKIIKAACALMQHLQSLLSFANGTTGCHKTTTNYTELWTTREILIRLNK